MAWFSWWTHGHHGYPFPNLNPNHLQGQPQWALPLNREHLTGNLDKSGHLEIIILCCPLGLSWFCTHFFPLNLLVLTILRDQARIIIYGEDSMRFHFSCKSEPNDQMQEQTIPIVTFQPDYHEFYLHNLIKAIINVVYLKLPNKRNTRRSDCWPFKSEMQNGLVSAATRGEIVLPWRTEDKK